MNVLWWSRQNTQVIALSRLSHKCFAVFFVCRPVALTHSLSDQPLNWLTLTTGDPRGVGELGELSQGGRLALVPLDCFFLSGSFQTANKTRTLPSIIIGAMTIETTELVAERGFTFSRRSHASCRACLLVIFQRLKWPTTAAITQSVLRLHHSPLVTWTQPALYTLYCANVTFSVIFSFFKSDNAWCQLYDLHFDLRKIIYIDRFYGSLLALDLTCVSIRKALLSVQFFHFCVVVVVFVLFFLFSWVLGCR